MIFWQGLALYCCQHNSKWPKCFQRATCQINPSLTLVTRTNGVLGLRAMKERRFVGELTRRAAFGCGCHIGHASGRSPRPGRREGWWGHYFSVAWCPAARLTERGEALLRGAFS